MHNQEVIQERIRKKSAEIVTLERRINEAKAYIQALNDVLRDMEREEVETAAAEGAIREGSTVDQARKAILSHGVPMHLDSILKAIGREVSRESKASLNGSLAAYVRKGVVFTRPKPSTYGLVELEQTTQERSDADDLPADFGAGPPNFDDEIPF